jgi:hypothetical protein
MILFTPTCGFNGSRFFLPGCLPLLFVVGFLFCSVSGEAQFSHFKRRGLHDIPLANTGQLGFTIGPTFYAGELNADGFSFGNSTSVGLGLFGHYNISNVFGVRIQLLGGFLNGGTMTTQVGNETKVESFSGVFLEVSANSTVNILNLITPYESTPFSLYTILGIGVGGWYSKLATKIYYFDSLSSDNPLQNFNAAPLLPLGLGFQYRIGKRLSLGLDYTARFYFSDKLDNTEGTYRNDIIHYLSFGIALNLGTGNSSRKRRGPYPLLPDPYIKPSSTGECPPPKPPEKKPEYKPEPLVAPPTMPPSSSVFTYVVQIFAFAHHNYTAEWIARKYHIPIPVRRERIGSVDRFLVGDCPDLPCARALKQQMITLGIRDAFIVSYQNGQRGKIIKN